MMRVNIDGKEIKAYPGQTILEVARLHGIHIPTLCYDERLKPDGACVLCMVEIEGQEGLLRACASEISNGMIIHTHSEKVKVSRKLTLELLLSDHRGDCRPPCTKACPAETDCQGYVAMIANGHFKEALSLIREKIVLPASIGLICPHPCEEACRRQMVDEAIAIAGLKAYVGEKVLEAGEVLLPSKKAATGKKVAIIGAGPAGLATGYDLIIEGHEVTIYDAMPEAGGMLRYGIPQYRLPKDLLNQEIAFIEKMGVDIRCNTRIGSDISLDYLRRFYHAVFLGIGAWKSSKIGCPGEELKGVWGGIDFLREVALEGDFFLGQRVVVIGGGNTAMDAARTAVRCGAREVIVAYRRTRDEMPAENIEIEEAAEEGVMFKFLRSPLFIEGEQGKVKHIRLQVMELGEADSSGRRRPLPVSGEEEFLDVDSVIGAIGQDVVCPFNEVETGPWGNIVVHENHFMTNLSGVFAGGDAVTGPGIAIAAMAQGKKAARGIHAYLTGQKLESQPRIEMERDDLSPKDFAFVPKAGRMHFQHAPVPERRHDFRRVSRPFNDKEAGQEAGRCLECGCKAYFECKLIDYSREYEADIFNWAGNSQWEELVENHPFLAREPEKCILCGLCVRVCDEVMGITALGFVKRGFEARVKPEFGLPWEESSCISCGQCVALCPTGALTEKYPLSKNLPANLRETYTICSFCSMGCKTKVHSYGDQVVRIHPDQDHLLCTQGRFAFSSYQENRVVQPMINREGQYQTVTWTEAMQMIALQTVALRSQYGGESLAVAAAPSLTVEELSVLVDFATLGLDSKHLSSFSIPGEETRCREFVVPEPEHSLEEMENTDLIYMVGSFKTSLMACTTALKAAKSGTAIGLMNQEGNLLSDFSQIEIHPPNSAGFIWEMIAAVVNEKRGDQERIDQELAGNPELCCRIKNLDISEEARQLARFYTKGAKAMMIIDGSEVTYEGVKLLKYLAYLSGHTGTPRNGFIIVYPGANTVGMKQAGFITSTNELLSGDKNRIKGLYVFEEDPLGAGLITDDQLKQIEFLVVAASRLNHTALKADIILPWSSPLENQGTYLRCDGKEQQLYAVQKPLIHKSNVEILTDLARAGQKSPGRIIREETEVKGEEGNGGIGERIISSSIPAMAKIFHSCQDPNPALIAFREKYFSA